MSTWTSSPKYLVAALVGAASILLAPAPRASISSFDGDTAPSPASWLPVLDHSVVIWAPSGYCIDPLASFAETRRAFVLLAACDAVSGDGQRAGTGRPGLLTASVDGSAETSEMPPLRELERFFASGNGRAVLSRSGEPGAISVDRSYTRRGVFYVHAQEAGRDAVYGGGSWRAVFEINGRMVTTTLRDLEGQPIDTVEGFRTIETFVDRIIAASGERP